MKVTTIVGARPQFIKMAALSRRLRLKHEEFVIHTGQHYDANMSEVFFAELGIPRPDVYLEIGSANHGSQTGQMLIAIEAQLTARRPDIVLVYGDTNSTLAGALAAAKLDIPVAHVESGLRSHQRSMPEEINRVVTDHVSAYLFCPSETAVENLRIEGITTDVHLVGDIMMEALVHALEVAERTSTILETLGVQPGSYLLATVHRAHNTDDDSRLAAILDAINHAGERVVFPVHPRTLDALNKLHWKPGPSVTLTDPLGYLDMTMLASRARLILTDSGGLQKEAYWLRVPCVTLREETEWTETVDVGWNVLAGAQSATILHCIGTLRAPATHPTLYGAGTAAEQCATILSLRAENAIA